MGCDTWKSSCLGWLSRVNIGGLRLSQCDESPDRRVGFVMTLYFQLKRVSDIKRGGSGKIKVENWEGDGCLPLLLLGGWST